MPNSSQSARIFWIQPSGGTTLPAQPWTGSEHDAGHAARGLLFDHGADVVDAEQVAVRVGLPELAAVAVAARHQEEARRAQPLADIQPRQADRAHGLAVEVAMEGDELELAGGRAHHPQARLHRGGARVVELHAGELLLALAHARSRPASPAAAS